MDPVALLILCVGVAYALGESNHKGRASRRAAGAKARQAATSRAAAGTAKKVVGRTARLATFAWWWREVWHAFPEHRGGFAEGWAHHRQAVAAREHQAATRDAAHEAERLRWAREIAAHRQRIADARAQAEKAAAKTPGQAPPLRLAPRAAPAAARQQPAARQQRAAPAAAPRGRHAASRASANGGQTVAAEGNYDSVIERSTDAAHLAEATAGERILTAVERMGDEVAGMLPDDSTAQGKAGDLATAVQAARDALHDVQDKALALAGYVKDKYGGIKEAKDAAGVVLPPKEFVEG